MQCWELRKTGCQAADREEDDFELLALKFIAELTT